MGDQLGGIYKQPGRDPFFQSMAAPVAHLLTNQNEITRCAFVDAAFAGHDRSFHFRRWIIKVDRDKTLTRRLLQVFENRLIAGIVRDNQHEIRWRFQDRAALFNRETTPVISQWVNDYDRIFASFNDFVEIANCAITHSRGKWSIVPDGFLTFDQKATHQIG